MSISRSPSKGSLLSRFNPFNGAVETYASDRISSPDSDIEGELQRHSSEVIGEIPSSPMISSVGHAASNMLSSRASFIVLPEPPVSPTNSRRRLTLGKLSFPTAASRPTPSRSNSKTSRNDYTGGTPPMTCCSKEVAEDPCESGNCQR